MSRRAPPCAWLDTWRCAWQGTWRCALRGLQRHGVRSGERFGDDLDIDVARAAGYVDAAKGEGFAGDDDGGAFQNGLPDDRLLHIGDGDGL